MIISLVGLCGTPVQLLRIEGQDAQLLNLRDCVAVELIVVHSRHGTFKTSPGQSPQSTKSTRSIRTAFKHDPLPTVSNGVADWRNWSSRGFDINKLINIENSFKLPSHNNGAVAKWKLKYVHSGHWLFNQFHKPPIIV